MNARVSITKDFRSLNSGKRKMCISVYVENCFGEFDKKLFEIEIPAEKLMLALSGELVDCEITEMGGQNGKNST